MRLFCTLVALLTMPVLSAPAWGEPVESRYREAAASYHSLAGDAQATPAQWRAVAEEFYSLFGEHTSHERGPDGLYSSALALLSAQRAGGGARDLALALGRFQQFLRAYPNHRLADDSLMQVGGIFSIHPDDAQRAYLTYRQVLAAYPNGDQAQLAANHAAALEAKKGAGVKGSSQARSQAVSRRQVNLPGNTPINKPVKGPVTAKASKGQAPSATIKRVLFSTLGDYTRVILTTDEVVDYIFRELPAKNGKPPRIYIDIKNARPRSGLAAEHPVDDGMLKKIRIRKNNNLTRVVFDLNVQGRYDVKQLDLPHEKKIIIDLYPRQVSGPVVSASAPVARGVPRETRTTPAPPPMASPASLRDALGLKVKNLVIDPGHGGHDPGASAFGLKEKDVALKLSEELKAVFGQRRPDINVSLTRDRDVFLSLGQRPAIAKSKGADLFVSIHLNAHSQERFSGIETYFLNLTSDASALLVAARENLSTDRQIGDLNGILRDLMQDTNIVESSKLANFLQDSLVTGLQSNYNVRSLGVKQAPFMVLIGAEMPSVLVEAGFLTNRRENKRLRDGKYLRKIAEGIYEGLQKYIQEQKFALDAPLTAQAHSGQDS